MRWNSSLCILCMRGGGTAYPPGHRSTGFFLFDALSPLFLLIGRAPSTVRWAEETPSREPTRERWNTPGGRGGGGVKVTSAPCSDLEENNVAGPSAVEETLSPDLPRCNRDCNARQCMASAGAVATDRHRPLPSGVEGAADPSPWGCPVPVSDFSFSTKRRKKKEKTLNPVREHRRAAAAARFADDVEVARVRACVCVAFVT